MTRVAHPHPVSSPSTVAPQRRARFPRAIAAIAALSALLGIGVAAGPPSSWPNRELSWSDKQSRFQDLDRNALEELQNRRRRYLNMPEPKQERLRELHAAWLAHPQRDLLLDTMYHYTQWLKSLSAEQRTNIRSEVGARERFHLVTSLRRKQAEAVFGLAGDTQLPQKDVQRLFAWTREFLEQKREPIMAVIREREAASERGEGRPGDSRRGGRGFSRPEFLFRILSRSDSEAAEALIQADDIEALKRRLSPEAAAIIEAQTELADKRKLITRWIAWTIDAMWNPPVDERDLREFFETEMTTDQRQLVENLEPERRMQYIRILYVRQNSPGRRDRSNEGESTSEDRREPPDRSESPDDSGG